MNWTLPPPQLLQRWPGACRGGSNSIQAQVPGQSRLTLLVPALGLSVGTAEGWGGVGGIPAWRLQPTWAPGLGLPISWWWVPSWQPGPTQPSGRTPHPGPELSLPLLPATSTRKAGSVCLVKPAPQGQPSPQGRAGREWGRARSLAQVAGVGRACPGSAAPSPITRPHHPVALVASGLWSPSQGESGELALYWADWGLPQVALG